MTGDGEVPAIDVKPWRDRSNTIGILPGKGTAQTDALRQVLAQLPLPADGQVEVVSAQGQPRKVPSEEVFVRQLSRGAFVQRDGDVWRATPQALHWLLTDDDLYLSRYIQGNVKYFAELLAAITEESGTTELKELASSYGLHWASSDQVGRRLSWMQSLGLVERWSFSRLAVTERGRAFLQSVDVASPEEVFGEGGSDADEPADLPEPDPLVDNLLKSLQPDDLPRRRTIVGYIPRGRKAAGRPNSADHQGGIVDAVRNFVELLADETSADELFERAQAAFGQKKSSFTQSMHTFRNMGLIDLVSFNRFGLTEATRVLLHSGNEVDLVRYLHARYRFIGELLANLEETTQVSELVKIAEHRFGLSQIDGSEVRTRLNFLADAGLVERIDWTRYRATSHGRALVGNLVLEMPEALTRPAAHPSGLVPAEAAASGADEVQVRQVIEELRRSGNAGDASEDFEVAVAKAFELLGFHSEHLGGKGRTDVLIQAELAPSQRFRAIADAKSSASGLISDNAIKFDALKDHIKKHKADYGMVVGPGFATRVKEWAVNNKFTLVTIDELVDLIERHQQAPLTVQDLRDLFAQPGSHLSMIEEAYDKADRTIELARKILEVLYQEANDEDPIADGYMSLENLQFVLRKEVSPRPSREAIDDNLSLLASPIIRAVEKNGDRFRISDAPANVGRRLRGLGFGLFGISAPEI